MELEVNDNISFADDTGNVASIFEMDEEEEYAEALNEVENFSLQRMRSALEEQESFYVTSPCTGESSPTQKSITLPGLCNSQRRGRSVLGMEYERVLGPNALLDCDDVVKNLQNYSLGCQNDSYDTYTLADYEQDTEFYESKFAHGKLPQIGITNNFAR